MYRSTRPLLQAAVAGATLLSLAGCASLAPVSPPQDVWDLVTEPPPDQGRTAAPEATRTHPPSPAAPEPSPTPEPSAEAPSSPEPTEAEERQVSEPAASRSVDRAPVPTPAPEPSPTAPADSGSASPAPPAPPASRAPTGPHAGPFGVTDAAALTPRGDGTIREDGVVIEDATISGTLILTGNDQRVRNVRVEGALVVRGTGVTVEDSDVGAFVVSGGKDVVATRLNVFGQTGSDGIHVTSDTGRVQNVLIEDSWVHTPRVTPTSHYDGIQVRGVDGLTLRGNTFDLGPFKPQYNASIFLENANGGNTNVTIEGNHLDGGGYAVYLGGQNTRFVNNTFGPSAGFGLLYPRSDMSSVTTSGNIGPDGRPAGF